MNPQVVIIKKDKCDNILVLLIKRRDTSVWTLPGGRRKNNESIQAAAIREASEETGYNIRLIHPIGNYDLPYLPFIGSTFLFVGEVINGSPSINKEVSDIQWFNPRRLPYTLLPFQHERIQDAIKGKKNVKTRQLYNSYNLLRHYIFFPHILVRLILFYFKRHNLSNPKNP